MKEQQEIISKVYIQDCFNAIFPCSGLGDLITSLEQGDLLLSRVRFHDVVESLKPEHLILAHEDVDIYNARVDKYHKVNKLYDKLIYMIELSSLQVNSLEKV